MGKILNLKAISELLKNLSMVFTVTFFALFFLYNMIQVTAPIQDTDVLDTWLLSKPISLIMGQIMQIAGYLYGLVWLIGCLGFFVNRIHSKIDLDNVDLSDWNVYLLCPAPTFFLSWDKKMRTAFLLIFGGWGIVACVNSVVCIGMVYLGFRALGRTLLRGFHACVSLPKRFIQNQQDFLDKHPDIEAKILAQKLERTLPITSKTSSKGRL